MEKRWVIQQMALGQLENQLSKNETVSISHTFIGRWIPSGSGFKCKKWKQRSTWQNTEELFYNLRIGKATLTIT